MTSPNSNSSWQCPPPPPAAPPLAACPPAPHQARHTLLADASTSPLRRQPHHPRPAHHQIQRQDIPQGGRHPANTSLRHPANTQGTPLDPTTTTTHPQSPQRLFSLGRTPCLHADSPISCRAAPGPTRGIPVYLKSQSASLPWGCGRPGLAAFNKHTTFPVTTTHRSSQGSLSHPLAHLRSPGGPGRGRGRPGSRSPRQ